MGQDMVSQSLLKASAEMLDYANKQGHLQSADPADIQSKMWTLRNVMQNYLAVQHTFQAFAMLHAIEEGEYGVTLSSRFYDPFTNYYGVRGRVERFNHVLQLMTNRGTLHLRTIRFAMGA